VIVIFPTVAVNWHIHVLHSNIKLVANYDCTLNSNYCQHIAHIAEQ